MAKGKARTRNITTEAKKELVDYFDSYPPSDKKTPFHTTAQLVSTTTDVQLKPLVAIMGKYNLGRAQVKGQFDRYKRALFHLYDKKWEKGDTSLIKARLCRVHTPAINKHMREHALTWLLQCGMTDGRPGTAELAELVLSAESWSLRWSDRIREYCGLFADFVCAGAEEKQREAVVKMQHALATSGFRVELQQAMEQSRNTCSDCVRQFGEGSKCVFCCAVAATSVDLAVYEQWKRIHFPVEKLVIKEPTTYKNFPAKSMMVCAYIAGWMLQSFEQPSAGAGKKRAGGKKRSVHGAEKFHAAHTIPPTHALRRDQQYMNMCRRIKLQEEVGLTYPSWALITFCILLESFFLAHLKPEMILLSQNRLGLLVHNKVIEICEQFPPPPIASNQHSLARSWQKCIREVCKTPVSVQNIQDYHDVLKAIIMKFSNLRGNEWTKLRAARGKSTAERNSVTRTAVAATTLAAKKGATHKT